MALRCKILKYIPIRIAQRAIEELQRVEIGDWSKVYKAPSGKFIKIDVGYRYRLISLDGGFKWRLVTHESYNQLKRGL